MVAPSHVLHNACNIMTKNWPKLLFTYLFKSTKNRSGNSFLSDFGLVSFTNVKKVCFFKVQIFIISSHKMVVKEITKVGQFCNFSSNVMT